MRTAKVKEVILNASTRVIEVFIDAKDSMYVGEPEKAGFPILYNSAPLIEGFNYILEHGHVAIDAMKGNNEFLGLVNENKELKKAIKNSLLADRIRQFLSAFEYEKLTDFQAKCVLLIEKELK